MDRGHVFQTATDTEVLPHLIESHFDGRLRFPCDFVGRGDMSRGGLMLRCVLHRKELEYIPIAGATRHGKKPPRLRPLR